MHMSDALITPLVGGAMLLTSGGLINHAAKRIERTLSEAKLPLMGVLGAFVFASQMVNFAIPGTGSSGHIGGGLLLAILLGPYAGFLTLGAVLFIQAMFFADGGLLAFGCNLFNMGFFTCFVVYPFVYKKITVKMTKKRIFLGALLASVIGLQLGAFFVVVETFLSGRVSLNIGQFLWFMQPIHLAIGLIEGLITAVIISYLYAKSPDLLKIKKQKTNPILIFILVIALLIGGGLSLMASSHPDGLEWSMEKSDVYLDEGPTIFSTIQDKLSFLPDYAFKDSEEESGYAGIIGSGITLMSIMIIGSTYQIFKRKKQI